MVIFLFSPINSKIEPMGARCMGNQVDIIALIDLETPLPVKQCLERCDHGFRVEQASDMVAFRRLILSRKFDCILSSMESPSVGDVICFQLTHRPPIPVVLFPLDELAHHGLEHYERLAVRIRRRVESGRPWQSESHEAPAVLLRGDEIYLRGVDGSDVFWGREGQDSQGVAREMELELRAIDHVRDRLAAAVSDVTEELYLSDVEPEHVSDIVYEGYRKLLLWFRDLDAALGHREGN
jgi:hypothetical protein